MVQSVDESTFGKIVDPLSLKKYYGYYSNISETDKYIIKSISCNPNKMSWSEAENLKEHILFYKKELNILKIPNPQLKSCKIEEFSNDRYILEIKEEKIKGETISNLVSNNKLSDSEYLKYCKQILEYYVKVFANGSKISIDPPLSNFVVGNNNKGQNNIYYVDSMPPRQQSFNHWIVEYPGPKVLKLQNYHYKRHFTKSLFQVVFVQMCRLKVLLRKELVKIFVNTFSANVLNYIKTPDTAASIFNLLNSCNISDIDYIRNIALELLYLNIISENEFSNIYKQTHIQEGSGDLPDQKELTNLNIFLLTKLKNKCV